MIPTGASLIKIGPNDTVLNPDLPRDRSEWKAYEEYLKTWFGTRYVTVLHTPDRAVASSREFVRPLRTTTGVYIGTGNAGRLAATYVGTPHVSRPPLVALRYGFIDNSIVVVTEGLGRQRFHGRVVILVNEHTASAGEMVAAFAAENRLGTVVGAKTPALPLSGRTFRVGSGYILGLPVAAYLTWHGTIIEGKGVTPQIPVELSADQLLAGEDTQMQQALAFMKDL